jgi:hypothetical protein
LKQNKLRRSGEPQLPEPEPKDKAAKSGDAPESEHEPKGPEVDLKYPTLIRIRNSRS